jgi:predicted RNA binding protein YcfA (HicA-like mRNA interferase family)
LNKHEKLLQKIVRGESDANVPFKGLCQLLLKLGFEERSRGSHHIFTKLNVEELVNLQRDGAKAKTYQVRQVRTLILKYELELP